MPAAPSPRSYGLVIQPTGNFRVLSWNPTVNTPEHALRCDIASSADLAAEPAFKLTAWHDPSAAVLGHRINGPASALLSLYAPLPPRYGDVVVTAGADTAGRTLGLDLDQTLTLLDNFLQRPRRIPRQRCR